MHYVIMRRDLSSILHEDGEMITFINPDTAEEYAKNVCGVVKPREEAISILEHEKTNRKSREFKFKIGRWECTITLWPPDKGIYLKYFDSVWKYIFRKESQ